MWRSSASENNNKPERIGYQVNIAMFLKHVALVVSLHLTETICLLADLG